MNILIIGADGYMGWPLACQLSAQEDVSSIVLLDNCITRDKVELVGGNSITPILTFQERGRLLQAHNPRKNIRIIQDSVLNGELVDDLTKQQFDVIYHLGHLRTAPYSMSSKQACIETVHNNEIGFLNLIWSLKENSRETLVVKLGSFGAYAPTGLEIPEGDIHLQVGSSAISETTVPYPKFATDFYHITKANDSLFARAACKNWSLKIIDVMQSTVFGCYNKYTQQLGEHTRFDYDEIYGTVVNRFLVQGLVGLNLSVYGDGGHSSGIMVLEDATKALSELRKEVLSPSQYRVVNNNPASYKIIDLANSVKSVLAGAGIMSEISVDKFDPRHEKNTAGKYHVTTAESRYFDDNFTETKIEIEIQRSMKIIENHLDRVSKDVVYPKLDWSK
ncbi:NAD-dependent epimerase/dehydratase family protein [Amylibacter sp.]|nr:NAD-dependent epimerase/dehydratase family protein [Amylibacter sp.]